MPLSSGGRVKGRLCPPPRWQRRRAGRLGTSTKPRSFFPGLHLGNAPGICALHFLLSCARSLPALTGTWPCRLASRSPHHGERRFSAQAAASHASPAGSRSRGWQSPSYLWARECTLHSEGSTLALSYVTPPALRSWEHRSRQPYTDLIAS